MPTNTPISFSRPLVTEREVSPPRPPSILKKRPMAAMRSDQKAQKAEKSTTEYRIIVSNLRNTVTGGDIEVRLTSCSVTTTDLLPVDYLKQASL